MKTLTISIFVLFVMTEFSAYCKSYPEYKAKNIEDLSGKWVGSTNDAEFIFLSFKRDGTGFLLLNTRFPGSVYKIISSQKRGGLCIYELTIYGL